MPQMFPLNWIILFTFFTTFFLYMIIYNYYFFKLINKKNQKLAMKINKLNWKW